MTRSDKKKFVEDFQEIFSANGCMLVVRQVGLAASAVSELRRSAHKMGITFQVIKNRLARRCFDETAHAELTNLFSGPTGVFFAKDPVETAKLIHSFSKKRENLSVGSFLCLLHQVYAFRTILLYS